MSYFKSRITSRYYIPSLSVCTELLVAKKLIDRLGRDRVEIYPKIETGFSDVLVRLGKRTVYLEVGNLGESLPEKKIRRILEATAKHLGNRLKDRCYFSLRIDTAELVLTEKDVSMKRSPNKKSLRK